MNLSFSSYGWIHVPLLIYGAIYWTILGNFNPTAFWYGLVGSFVSAIGIAALTKALSDGPIGPVLTVADGYPPLLAILDAVKN